MKMKTWRGRLAVLAAALSLLGIWQVASLFMDPWLLPGVPATMIRLAKLIRQPAFASALRESLLRLAVGYGVAMVLGGLLGLLAGISKSFAGYLRSLIAILQSIPPITWAPFLIILMGFGNGPVIIIVGLASFFPMALSVMNATEGTNRTHLELARVLGASRWQLLAKVYAPEALPAFVTGAQLAFGNAWRSLVAGEMVVGATKGLGGSIKFAGEVADMAGVLAGIVIIGVIASVIDHVVLEQVKRRLLRYRTAGGGEAA
jgi:NitT/TauT family transport system permease protein